MTRQELSTDRDALFWYVWIPLALLAVLFWERVSKLYGHLSEMHHALRGIVNTRIALIKESARASLESAAKK